MRSKRAIVGAIAGLGAAILAAGPATAQTYVYPARGQSPEQQNRDLGECHLWAQQQSGVNPSAMPPPSTAPQGQVARGAARGAAVGAVGGAIGGDAGRGAAIGAASGALIGGMRRRDQQRAQEQASAQAVASYQRAYGACLEGRGYTVR